MDYHEHKNYFETAYKTGSDVWTHVTVENQGKDFVERLVPGALVLELGSGRGLFAKHLAESGFRVIGLDFAGDAVKRADEEVKNWGLAGKLKFVEANALDIPF